MMEFHITLQVVRIVISALLVVHDVRVEPHRLRSVTASKLTQHLIPHSVAPVAVDVRGVDVHSDIRSCIIFIERDVECSV